MSRQLRLALAGGVFLGLALVTTFAARGAEPAASRPLGLPDCIALGLENQPAISAAQSSLGAALVGQRGLDNLKFAGLLSRDVPIRREQAAWGVNIAAAGVQLAEWDTRYAVIRMYFTVMYAHQQGKLLDRVIKDLAARQENAKDFVDVKDSKVSATDVLILGAHLDRLRAKHAEAKWGLQKAVAALREAMGIHDPCPLELIDTPFPDLVEGITCKEVVALAMDRRGEIVQAGSAQQLTALEIEAQRRLRFRGRTHTFASGADVHSRPIPQGFANHEYRPAALGLEMPVFLIGRRSDRMDRAGEFSGRAGAVVEKTENLVALEAEITFYKWMDAVERIQHLGKSQGQSEKAAADATERFSRSKGNLPTDEMLRAITLKEETASQYIEALYAHALALAALERVTAGGLRFTYSGTPIAIK